MEKEAAQFGITPFSYDILDREAAKISNLILAVNQKFAGNQADAAARELYQWAEEMSSVERPAEAEFLYLHAINIWQRHHQLTYPINFVSLREYARLLLSESDAKITANNITVLAEVSEVVPAPEVLGNAA